MKNFLLVPFFVLLIQGCNPLIDTYQSEVKERLASLTFENIPLLQEEEISELPEVVQKYIRYTGSLNKEKILVAEAVYKDARIKMNPDRNWLKVTCQQMNFTEPPSRHFYIHSRLLGIVPFNGRDIYAGGQGNMRIRLFNAFTVADDTSSEMDQSALVTYLQEPVIMPSAFLSEQIEWIASDSISATARISDHGIAATGTFFFNQEGKITRFVTNDRYYAPQGEKPRKIKWSITFVNYKNCSGFMLPTQFVATWHMDEGDFIYIKGDMETIKFNNDVTPIP